MYKTVSYYTILHFYLVATEILKLRRNEYKVAALQAKRAGDKMTALKYMKMTKVCLIPLFCCVIPVCIVLLITNLV